MVHLRPAFLLFIVLTFITGIVYPITITIVGQILFPHGASGSFVKSNNKPIYSELIGQPINQAKSFWTRPSATSTYPYNAALSCGSNLGPTNPALLQAIKERVTKLKESDLQNHAAVPIDLVTTSASGLDPHISPEGALYQIPRIAKMRGISEEKLRELVEKNIEERALGILGEKRVNVMKLNSALEQIRN